MAHPHFKSNKIYGLTHRPRDGCQRVEADTMSSTLYSANMKPL